MRALILSGLLLLLPTLALSDEADSDFVTVTYLANEGFMLEAGEHKVLIDALFPGVRFYPRVPEPTRSELETAQPPFDSVDLVLASHFHDDHFGAREVGRHLQASRASGSHPPVFVSTPDAVDKLRHALNGDLPFDVAAYLPAEGKLGQVDLSNGIQVSVLNLHHGRGRQPEVQNLGFVVDLGGFKILHVGDTEADLKDFRPLRLATVGIDLALLPGWFLTEERWVSIVRDEIQSKAIAAMHLATPGAPASWFGSAGNLETRVARIRQAFPDAWIPLSTLESRSFSRVPANQKER